MITEYARPSCRERGQEREAHVGSIARSDAAGEERKERRAGLSERTLHRRFLAGVGYGPKRLCRIARLGVARALAVQGIGGADLAAEAGYFDQAHLCHEVASFGLTPASLAR